MMVFCQFGVTTFELFGSLAGRLRDGLDLGLGFFDPSFSLLELRGAVFQGGARSGDVLFEDAEFGRQVVQRGDKSGVERAVSRVWRVRRRL
jgi:hypothetical protein